mgnify:CR=1 FL=1
MKKILIADDEVEIVKLVSLYVESDYYELFCAYDGDEAKKILEKTDIDLAIIDIMMPKINGYELIKYIRDKNNKYERYIPIIVISAKVHLSDRILGLDLGADDYLTKPFEPLELVAKVKGEFRRSEHSIEKKDNSKLTIGEISLNIHQCTLEKNGNIIDLTSSEFKVLMLFMKNPRRVFTNEQIYEYAWSETSVVDDNTIRVIISKLRSKIGHEHIVTIRGLGYRYEK